MKLDIFIKLFDQKAKNGQGEDYLKERIKNVYIPFEKKADVAKAILDASYWRTRDDESKELHIDSVAKYMLSCVSLIDLYTDIERSKKENSMLDDFNKLNERGIFDMVIGMIDKRELKEFNMVLQMTADDLMTNEYEGHAFVRNQVERFGNLIGAVLGPVLKEIDLEKIQDIAKQLQT